MAKFVEIYFHFVGQGTVRRSIINVDEIDRVDESKNVIITPGGEIKETSEYVLFRKDGTQYVLEQDNKEKVIKQLLEL